MMRALRTICLATLLGALLAAVPAAATVPPTDCGLTVVKGKRYDIKTHLVTCKRGKPMARAYLRTGRRPKGWSCRNYSAKVTRFRFICRRGGRDFLAIRR
jgi:hypothetical protein